MISRGGSGQVSEDLAMRISSPFPRIRERSGAKLSGLRGQRWLVLPLVLVLIAGIVFWQIQVRSAPAAVTTATVSQGDLTIAVTGSGAVAAARVVDLPFQQSGTITSVAVKVGDQVQAGQTLAQLDTSDLQLQVQQAQASLKAAEAKLTQVKGGSPTEQDKANAQASLDSAKAQLQKTKTSATTDLQSAQAALASAQARLAALKNPSAADLSAAETQLAQAQTSAETQRDSLSQAKTNAYNQMQQAVNSLTQAQSRYATAQKNWQYVQDTGSDPANPTSIDPATGKSRKNKLSDTQRQQYYDTYIQAEAAMHSAETAVQQAQVSYDTARQNESAQAPLLDRQVANAQAQLDALKNPSASDIQQAQSAVTQARAQLTALQNGGTQASLASAEAQVIQARSNLDSLTAPGAAPDVAAAEASLIQAQANLAIAQRNLEQATLKAPFDGVVSAVGIVPGASTGSGGGSSNSSSSTSSAAITMVDRSTLHIDVNLSESDAARVQIGQPVTLTFDALPNVTITGQVATIAPAATVEQNVVTFPVQIEFDPGTTPVKVGMSATADIQIQQITNAILVPSRAVQTSGGTKTVTLLQGPEQVPVTVQVETGATSNGRTEIVSCVDTGAQCLRAGDTLSVAAATTQTSTQGGGFGPRGPGGIPFGR
jgi:HlyD family secretion protein